MVIGNVAFSQYFLGTFTNVGNKVTVKIKPTGGDINGGIGQVDFFIRYNPASTPAFTVQNVIPNPANFSGLSGLAFTVSSPVTQSDGYAYIEFLYTSTIAAGPVFTNGTEYELVSFTINGSSSATALLELASDFTIGSYYFVIADAAGNPYDNLSADPPFYGSGIIHPVGTTSYFLPLANIPLPVKFLGFDVSKERDAAIINWSVENEDAQTDKYIIEKSANSIDFTPIATVKALNNGRGSNTYSFTQDNLSGIRNSGVLYFRIKQIDKDGKFVYTLIRNLRLDGKAFAVNAYPNPVKDITKLTIDLLDESKLAISITDAGGKQVKNIQFQGFKGPNIKEVNLSDLSSGNYMLKVQSGTEVKSFPLVKVN